MVFSSVNVRWPGRVDLWHFVSGEVCGQPSQSEQPQVWGLLPWLLLRHIAGAAMLGVSKMPAHLPSWWPIYIYIYSVLVSTAVRNLASVTVTAAAAAAATTATTTTAAATAQNGKMVTVAAVAVTNTMITYDNDDDQTRERFWLDFCKQSKWKGHQGHHMLGITSSCAGLAMFQGFLRCWTIFCWSPDGDWYTQAAVFGWLHAMSSIGWSWILGFSYSLVEPRTSGDVVLPAVEGQSFNVYVLNHGESISLRLTSGSPGWQWHHLRLPRLLCRELPGPFARLMKFDEATKLPMRNQRIRLHDGAVLNWSFTNLAQ